jgi:hypothetical protein
MGNKKCWGLNLHKSLSPEDKTPGGKSYLVTDSGKRLLCKLQELIGNIIYSVGLTHKWKQTSVTSLSWRNRG